ncbi:hypothetical protein DH2020_046611 [Rehmannia glutinosa]|uniref:Mechanosensitive ion channel protein n=1 Tax=Rehmannia glutinosa TaxID=99300 RepID=A0ABR0UAR5_REHGL
MRVGTKGRFSMEANGKAPKTSEEINMVENQKQRSDVIISIHEGENDSKCPIPDVSKEQKHKLPADSSCGLSNDSTFSAQKSVPSSCPSPEIVGFSPSPNKPPKIPKGENLTRRKSLSRSVYSKPKSRFGEQSMPIDSKTFENRALIDDCTVSSRSSPSSKVDNSRTVQISPKTPYSSPGGFGGVDEDEKIYMRVSSRKKLKYRKVKAKVLIEWFLLLCVLGCLIISLTVDKLQHWKIWDLRIWRWCVLVLVTFSGLLITEWLMRFVVLLIELNYLLKKKVLYFVYGLKKCVQVCIWLALVLLTWVLLIQEGVKRSSRADRVFDFITWTITSLLIGASLWVLKTSLLKILASSFHVNTFFDRIQDSIFHQYILQTLSGAPIMESASVLGKTSSNVGKFSPRVVKKGKEGKEKKEKPVIDINKLHQMKQEKVSAWTMKMLVDVISNSGLTTLSNAIDESVYGEGNEQMDKEITNEEEAIAAAYHIFRNVAQLGCKYIDELDLSRFMTKEEVEVVFPMIDVAETGQIDRKTLTDWVMIVEEMNILTTVFLRFDNEKIYYPNSVLATKPISNFYRSPDMGDSLEFSIDFKTPLEKIGALKDKIKKYLENNPQHWHPNHNVVVKEIENVNKIKMALFFNHTMNFQDFPEKSRRKTDLVLEMKKFFEELNIRYDLLPQDVHLVESKWATAPSGN